MGRATQGVKLIKVDDGDSIAAITQLDEQEEDTEFDEAAVVTDENGNVTEKEVKEISLDTTETITTETETYQDPTEEDDTVEPEEEA